MPTHRRRFDEEIVPRPTLRTALPFGVLAGIGVVVAAAPPYHLHGRHAVEVVAALVLLAAVAWLVVTQVRRGDSRRWVDPVGPWLSFVVVVLLSDITGGAGSGLGPLIALPVVWLALFGTRRDLAVGAVVGLVAMLTPLWLVGAPEYPAGDWRRVAIWIAIGAVLAPVVQQVVRQFGVETDRQRRLTSRERELTSRLVGIMHGATLVGLVTTDVEGRVTSFGAGAEALCGHSEAEMLGRPFAELVHDPDEMAEVAAELGVDQGFPVLAELARRRSPSRTWVCVRADGEPLVVRLGVSELRDDEGEPAGYLAVALDETEPVRTQQELSQAEARWRVLMDHLPDTIMMLVEQGTGIKVVTGAGLVGHRARDSAGRWLQELAAEADVPIGSMLDAAFAGQEQTAQTDASVGGREHEVTVCPLPSSTGRPQALVLLRDVSRDRRRERAITAAKERADRLFEDAPQGVALLSLEGVVVRANPAMSRLFGRDDLVGQPLSALSFRPDDSTVADHLAELLSGGSGHPVAQWSVRAVDGAEGHVALTSTLLAGEDGDVDLVLANLVDVSDRYRYEQKLAHLADHDPLTGLANRRLFDRELARHVEECRRYGVRGAVLVLDLDHFKQVNDTLGHAAGDELLTLVGGILRDRLRSSDLVARLGGDEFAVLLPHADRKAAEVVAQSMVEEIRDRLGTLGEDHKVVTVSVGGVLVENADLSATAILSGADGAMYDAKAAGRNQFVVHG